MLGGFIAERMAASESWGGLVTVGEPGHVIANGAADAGLTDDMMISCGCCTEAAEYLAGCTNEGDAILLKASRMVKLEIQPHTTNKKEDN